MKIAAIAGIFLAICQGAGKGSLHARRSRPVHCQGERRLLCLRHRQGHRHSTVR